MFAWDHKKASLIPNRTSERDRAFSGVTGGRAPSFHDLSVGEAPAPSAGEGNGGGGKFPSQISRRKDQPGSLGTQEKARSLSVCRGAMQTLLNVTKSLSLRHRFIIGEDRPEEVNYIGIYYRCDDLYFVFPRYRLPDRQEAYDIPIQFITATLLIEILESIQNWSERYFKPEFQEKEEVVCRSIWGILGVNRGEEPGVDTFRSLSARLKRERNRAAKKQRFIRDPEQKIGYYFGPEVLVRVCERLMGMFSFLNERPFFFFIDDYSTPKITSELQENLNRIFMQRSASSFFKLSTESSVSYARRDIDAKAYVEGREFTLLNLGLVYIHAKLREKSQFIDDVLARRLGAIHGYPVSTLEELIGSYSGPTNYNEVARQIRAGRRVEIWGRESLCGLCSGDIHYTIDLVRLMVSNIGGRDKLAEIDVSPKISAKEQTAAIREQAGNFLKGLRILPMGNHLVEVVTAFGIIANAYLRFRDSKNIKGTPPWQAHRIEPYEQLNLSEEAQKIYFELLRYSVFIEDVRGKSRRGKVVPRLYLRRLLIPHFRLTFSMRDSIELEPDEIESLLLDPKEFELKHQLRRGFLLDPTQPLLPGIETEDI